MRQDVLESDLKNGAVIGSSSPRRCAALKKIYPNAEVRICRGNVNSRFLKLDNKEYDAIVVSYAGLKRLKLETRVKRIFGSAEMLPAIGQGIVAIQIRKADINRFVHLKLVNDFNAETAAKVERALLFRLQGNCHSAIAGHCTFLSQTNIQLSGIVYNTATGDYIKSIRQAEISSGIEKLGIMVADDLISQGARAFMAG